VAYFAKLENNIVVQVISVSNDVCGEPTLGFPETESAGRAFIANTLKFDGVWKQTSFNNNFRKQYCGVGFTYLADADVFVAPQPFASWTLDSNHDWQPPTPMPSDASMENLYKWNEEELAWVAI
jgi:hypothetical protein